MTTRPASPWKPNVCFVPDVNPCAPPVTRIKAGIAAGAGIAFEIGMFVLPDQSFMLIFIANDADLMQEILYQLRPKALKSLKISAHEQFMKILKTTTGSVLKLNYREQKLKPPSEDDRVIRDFF